MGIESLINFFLSSDIRNIRLARLQVKFILISILIDISYLVLFSYIKFEVIQYVTVFSFIFLLGLLWTFKWGAKLRVISHLFVFYFWLVVVSVTIFSGGIQSYVLAWIALIPIMAISLLSSRAAWRWGIMGVITVLAFYFIEFESLVPSHLYITKNNVWNASLHIGLQFFVLTIAYIFGRNQNELIEKIEKQKQEISRQKDKYKTSYENIALLNKIGQDISGNISIENIIHSVYQNISALMNSSRFGIGIIDKSEKLLLFKDYSGNSDKFTTLKIPLKNTNRLAVHCVINNVEIISGDIKTEHSKFIPTIDESYANMILQKSIILLPLLINKEVIGCIGVQCKKIDAYTDYHVNLLRSISIDVSIAVENARIFAQLEKKSDENKILYELSSNLIESLDLDELLDKIMDSAVKVVPNAQSGSIFLHNAESNMLEGKVSYGISNELIKKVRLKEDEGISGKAMAEKRSFIENNYLEDTLLSPEHKQVLEQVKKPIKSIIVVLLKVKKKIIGTISIDNYDKNNAFTDVDLEILTSLAANASAAIERVRMYELIEEVNADLMMAYSKLKDLDEYKEAMTAMIVHDFKNSLNTVISFSEGAPTERRLKSIRQAGQFMLNMVLNILDVQKFETAKIKLALGNYPINKVIQEAIDQLSYTIEQKSIKLTYNKNGNISRIDLELITRVVVNILSNAIKYVSTNGEIEIITEKNEEDIYVAIKDNGPGIPTDKVHKVFDKFSQIDAKKSGSVRSTGIGLTFCKMVVEAHKGKIGVESKEGEGSVFYFTLPLVEKITRTTPEIEDSEIKYDQLLILSQKENKLLSPYLKELQKWEVYDYSEVTTIIENIESKKTKIKLWKDKMMKALQNVNEEEYNRLIKVIEYAEES